jgi:hypothetical protein
MKKIKQIAFGVIIVFYAVSIIGYCIGNIFAKKCRSGIPLLGRNVVSMYCVVYSCIANWHTNLSGTFKTKRKKFQNQLALEWFGYFIYFGIPFPVLCVYAN